MSISFPWPWNIIRWPKAVNEKKLNLPASGNIWVIHEKLLGVIDVAGETPWVIYIPELKNKMLSGFENMYDWNEANLFLSAEKGFYHINYEKYIKAVPLLHVQVRAVKISDKKDSLIFGGYFNAINAAQVQNKNNQLSIDNNWQTIHFEFSATVYGNQSNLEYAYSLKGFDNGWSDWGKRTAVVRYQE